MATRDELYKEAKAKGLDVKSNAKKAELEEALNSGADSATHEDAGGKKSEPVAETDNVETVKVNDNEGGEATNGTTKDGEEGEVQNTESIPQNGVDSIATLQTTDNEVAKAADAARTKEELEFADESNPNQKSRVNSTQGAEFDQDGRPRTGGKSYGVAADDVSNFEFPEENKGEKKESNTETNTGRVTPSAVQPGSFLNTDTNAGEWDVERQQEEEKALSDPENGIAARVLTSTGDYVRVKFFRNNLIFGTYRTRDYDQGEAKEFLGKLKKERGL